MRLLHTFDPFTNKGMLSFIETGYGIISLPRSGAHLLTDLLSIASGQPARFVHTRADLFGLMERLPKGKFVFLRRENEIRRAISHYISDRTGGTHSDRPRRHRVPDYCFREIYRYILHARQQYELTDMYFRYYNISPFRISYEDLLQETTTLISKVLDFFGVRQLKSVSLKDSKFQKQATQRNDDYHDRFLKEYQSLCPEISESVPRSDFVGRLSRSASLGEIR